MAKIVVSSLSKGRGEWVTHSNRQIFAISSTFKFGWGGCLWRTTHASAKLTEIFVQLELATAQAPRLLFDCRRGLPVWSGNAGHMSRPIKLSCRLIWRHVCIKLILQIIRPGQNKQMRNANRSWNGVVLIDGWLRFAKGNKLVFIMIDTSWWWLAFKML